MFVPTAKRLFAKLGERFRSPPTRLCPRVRLALNQLESREVPAVYVYDPTGTGANDWSNVKKWKDKVTGFELRGGHQAALG